ncbi:MAG: TIGR04086 family membrane protein [Clostridia bacterium]|nr:TIGR04086 family membrane protein [Clostridia bacterium]MDD6039585.1 TIGR04086 family membrane protein [Clostridia bacterium]
MSSYTTPGASRTTRKRSRRYRQKNLWAQLLRGLLVAIGATLVCVLVFALLMQWLKPSDSAIRIVNQLIKLASIFIGVKVMLGRTCEKGLLYGALLGVCYMALGVGLFAILSGQQLPWTAYLSDIAMGVAGGGICGAIVGGIK